LTSAKRLARVASCLAVAAILVACTRAGVSSSGEHSYTQAGTLRVEILTVPRSLNPIFAISTSEGFLADLAFNKLVTSDARGHDVPDLAAVVPTVENGGISRDGRSVTYHLRRHVRWQDGAPFTSADVKFSWQAVMNPQNNVVERRGYDDVASVDTPDADTVVFHLIKPFSPFVDTVFGESDEPYAVVPKHLLGNYAALNAVPFDEMPVGTGPFRVVRWRRGDQVEYVANDDYFKGPPHLRRIVVRFVSDDNTRESDLRSHVSDLAVTVTPPVFRDMRGDAGFQTLNVASPYYVALAMNTLNSPLGDLRVRQAIAHALDRKAIIQDDTYGTGIPATEDLATYYWAYDGSVPGYAYDPTQAATLLDAAGWKRGPDGMRANAGRSLEMSLVYDTADTTFRRLSVQVQAQLRAIGIDVHVKPFQAAMLYAAAAGGGVLTGNKWDLALSPWIAGADPDDSQQWMCAYFPPAGWNLSRICNPAIDAAENQALASFDRGVRMKAYQRIQTMLAQQVPAVFLYYQPRLYVMSLDLKHYAANGITDVWAPEAWSI
jgi:peptide/nickel transport system substrate-binding protein